MNSKLWLTLAAGAACLSSACSDFKVEDVPARYSLVVVQDEPAGENCAYGGKKIVSGIDVDRDGSLSVSEVTGISFACTGNSGDNALVFVDEVALGEEGCQFGGQRITTGIDKNADGELSESEIDKQWVICSGTAVSQIGRVEKISTYLNQTCALLTDETVQCWGQSTDGTDKSSAPVKVGGIYKVKDIASGCALSSDGIVRCWDGLADAPRAVVDLKGVKAIAGGTNHHLCAILEDTSAVCWGRNDAGQLGNGSFVSTTVPVPVIDANGLKLKGVKKIATGSNHTCALLEDSTLRCWGWNANGQLGLGTVGKDNFYNRANAVVDTNGTVLMSQVKDIALGYMHSCALLTSGEVKCWGGSSVGQLGKGATENQNYIPLTVDVAGEGKTVTALGAGYGHNCAAISDGTVKCWGWNVYAQLGNASVERLSAEAVDVANVGDVADLVLGEGHSCARLKNGLVKCWGNNAVGQFGNGVEAVNQGYDHKPAKVVEMENVSAVSAGYLFTCGLVPAGEGGTDSLVRCWGNNDYGQLGIGSFGAVQRFPVTVQASAEAGNFQGVSSISAGYIHACALTQDDKVYCWGDNSQLQLGTMEIPGSMSYPVAVGGLYNISSLATGHAHSCVTMLDGSVDKVKCWGYNEYGQLGNGATSNSPPQDVTGLNGIAVSQLALGRTHSCALLGDGTVQCWGNNRYGQMGVSGEDVPAPAAIAGISGAAQIAAGHAHTCALLTDGTVKCWGSNVYGECGQEIHSELSVAVSSVSLDGTAKKIATGYQHTCALLTDGTVKCWGSNAYGQLGNDVLVNTGTPVTISDLTDVKDIVTGYQHTCALLADGKVQCWGGDRYGQLGRVNGNPTPVDAAFVIQ